MKVSFGADERLPVIEAAKSHLEEMGHAVIWHGPAPGQTDPWPEIASQVARDLTSSRADQGILFCWTGTGVSMAANKVPGVRAALCVDAEAARGARLWNNANVLCMSLRLATETIAREILEMWFATNYKPNPIDDACLAQIEELDRARMEAGKHV
ncbi:MAG: RpiB/LacA/LacB family sugar-phosphate isomerase [Chloroflexi bacterium]|nr:RpiB/LacA/LacB family sugar-phosphate isomerase [Chloroflexota bacterium]